MPAASARQAAWPVTFDLSQEPLNFVILTGRYAQPALTPTHIMAERSKFQQRIIKNYYDNQGAILLQKLGEHVTELYLAEGKARTKRWQTIAGVLEKLKIPASRIKHIQESDDPALLAKLLEELLATKK
jgi:hypothetical protein